MLRARPVREDRPRVLRGDVTDVRREAVSRVERIETPHLLEAIQYRSLDRTVFY